jgi:Uma2 family endonuclease
MNILAEAVYTPDDLLFMPKDVRYELIDGKLVEKGMGARSDRLTVQLLARLEVFTAPRKLGRVFPESSGYVGIFVGEPNRLRKPDVSFVRQGKFVEDRVPQGWIGVVPDLAAEVVSPTNTASEVLARVVDYLRAGVPLVWVLDPETQLVQIFRQGGQASWLLGTGELSGEDVIPGFTCRIEELFAGI